METFERRCGNIAVLFRKYLLYITTRIGLYLILLLSCQIHFTPYYLKRGSKHQLFNVEILLVCDGHCLG